MIDDIVLVLIAGMIFIALILNLATKPALSLKVSKWLLVFTAVTTLIIYGYGFSVTIDNPLLAIIRALTAVCGTYIGRNFYSDIENVPGFQSTPFLIVFWTSQFLALYTSASAMITVLGADMIKSMRLALARKGDLVLIYGSDTNALNFGRECNGQKDVSVVFVSAHLDGGTIEAIDKMGAAFRCDKKAVHPSENFLASLGMKRGSRKLTLYCLDQDPSANLIYAREMMAALQKENIDPEQTCLILSGEEETAAKEFLTFQERYGYGNVTVIQKYSLASRILIQNCKPWEEISFDENGKAQDNFETLLLGFGMYNQSILTALIRNGQFCGSHFHTDVISWDCDQTAGYLRNICSGMFAYYDIQLLAKDARSVYVFDYLREHKDRLKFIVVSLGNDRDSVEITDQIRLFLGRMGCHIPVVRCSDEGIDYERSGSNEHRKYPLYSLNTLDSRIADRRAMEVNHTYIDDPNVSAWDAWKQCDFFSRMSSRASADFIPALLWSMHLTEEEAEKIDAFTLAEEGQEGDLKKGILSREQADILGRTEHDRWCAFHYTMGYQPMSDEIWEQRAAVYRMELEAEGKARIRVSKDAEMRLHDCLVSWEDLVPVARKDSQLTGKEIDYQQMDINNVLQIPRVLRSSK